MRFAALLCGLCLTALSASSVLSQTKPDEAMPHIGIVAPVDGPYALLGEQIHLGIEAAKRQNQYPVKLSFFPEACNAEQDAATAEKIRQQNISVVIGYLCSEALEGAAPVLAQDNIAIISLGSRQPTIMEQQARDNFGIIRLQADRKIAIDTLLEQLSPTWRSVPFALLEDGTVQGRDFARQTLQAFKARGLEPALTDTYRPGQLSQTALVAQLKRANVRHLLLGGEGDDAAVIARSAAAAGWPLIIAGNDSLLRADPLNPLPTGLLMSAIPPLSKQPAAQDAVKAISALAEKSAETQDMLVDGYALPAYAALQIAAGSLNDKKEPQQSIADYIRDGHFETVAGAMSFSKDGLRRENPYRLLRFNGKDFVPVTE